MRRGLGLALTAVAVGALAPASLASAQDETATGAVGGEVRDVTATVLDVSATVLDVEATIADIEAGTATTESVEEVTIALEADVFFDFDQDVLRADAVAALDDVVAQIRADGADEVRVEGHTDAVGDPGYNQGLSERRAAAVEVFLAERLDGVRIASEGFGETRPVAPNETEDGQDDPEGRALNRRVEITYPR